MNTTHLADIALQKRVTDLWAQEERKATIQKIAHQVKLARGIRNSKKLTRCWGKRKAARRREKGARLRKCLGNAQLRLEQNPQLLEAQTELDHASDRVTEHDRQQDRWREEILQARYIEEGDKCSKIFFKSFRSLAKSTKLHEIYSKGNLLLTDWTDIAKEAVDYFTELVGKAQDVDEECLRRVLEEQVVKISTVDRCSILGR
jgi:hypothetical protein